MKPQPPSRPVPVQPASAPAAPDGSPEQPAELGVTERRHVVRTLPAPLAVESDCDTDWDIFQSLISDKPTS